MARYKVNSVLLLFLLLISFPLVIPFQEVQVDRTSIPNPSSPHVLSGETITITSDSSFAATASALGFPGDGTSGNPYMIADIFIDYIRIEDTTVYFEIRRCYLDPTSDSRSIDLDNADNGLIDSCVIDERPNGIKVRSSTNITISNNILNSLSVESISIDYSSYCTIIGNEISDGGFGIQGYSPFYVVVDNNVITGCRDAINLPSSGFVNVTNNQVIDCSTGLLAGGSYLYVTNNTFVNAGVHLNEYDFSMTFANNTVNGLELGVFVGNSSLIIDGSKYGQIILYNCLDILIVNGTFHNLSYCIEMLSCYNCTVQNAIFDEVGHGVYLAGSDRCSVIKSSFLSNSWPIYSDFCEDLSIINSTIESDGDPVMLFESKNCSVVNNTFTESYINFKLGYDPYSYGSNTIDYFLHHIRNNTIDGRHLGYFRNQTVSSIDLDAYGQVIIVNSTGFSFSQSTITNRSIPIHVFHSTDIQITDCIIQNNDLTSIMFIYSDDCSIEDCQFIGTDLLIHYSERFNLLNNSIQTGDGLDHTFVRGVHMYRCDLSVISENTLNGPLMEGLQIYLSDNIRVIGNALERTYFGMIVEASHSLIAHNQISDGENNGLTLVRSTNTTVESNVCHVNSYSGRGNCLAVYYCNNCSIKDNSAILSIGSGLRLSDSYECTIESNILERNSEDGMYVDDSHNCTVVDNSIQGNNDYGIRVRWSSNNTFYLNMLASNYYGNALDDGYNNTWDNGIDTGNYWQDYIGSGIYEVPGNANSTDRYPMYMMTADGINPNIDHPDDIIYEFGTTGHTILWHATDDYPDTYQIEENGTIIDSGNWDTFWVSLDVDGLDVGSYNYTLSVCDEGGLWTSDTVLVMVTPPSTPTSNGGESPLLLIIAGGGIIVCAVVIIFWIRFKRQI